jgi:hypothetical protein
MTQIANDTLLVSKENNYVFPQRILCNTIREPGEKDVERMRSFVSTLPKGITHEVRRSR